VRQGRWTLRQAESPAAPSFILQAGRASRSVACFFPLSSRISFAGALAILPTSRLIEQLQNATHELIHHDRRGSHRPMQIAETILFSASRVSLEFKPTDVVTGTP